MEKRQKRKAGVRANMGGTEGRKKGIEREETNPKRNRFHCRTGFLERTGGGEMGKWGGWGGGMGGKKDGQTDIKILNIVSMKF